MPGKPGLAGDKMCGVGITFVEDSNGALYVKSLVPGGSAAQSGQVQVGDVLIEVNAPATSAAISSSSARRKDVPIFEKQLDR